MKLKATVCSPSRGVYTVDFDFLNDEGKIQTNMPTFTLPAETYEHARAVELAFNRPELAKPARLEG